MSIEAYIVTWNREDIIHLTINHYKQFCSKVVIYDNFSDDRTRDIAEEMGCEVRLFGKAGELNDKHYLEIKNNCWKGSSADYVIVCDDDEILVGEFESAKESIIRTQGYEMFSTMVPRETWLEVNTGTENHNYSKWIAFDPKRIREINYVYGCHVANPIGDISLTEEKMMLLHYRSIGGPERLIDRQRLYIDRLSQVNKNFGLGHHYLQSEDQKRREWYDSFKNSRTLF